jgi:FdhD protein
MELDHRAMTATPFQSRDFSVRKLEFAGREDRELLRSIPIEAPIAIEVCGIGYAVMMATPSDLRDYAMGFALAEGLADKPDDVTDIDIHQVEGSDGAEGGWILRIGLSPDKMDGAFARARKRVSESSCGLCGVENIEQVLRPLPPAVPLFHVPCRN